MHPSTAMCLALLGQQSCFYVSRAEYFVLRASAGIALNAPRGHVLGRLGPLLFADAMAVRQAKVDPHPCSTHRGCFQIQAAQPCPQACHQLEPHHREVSPCRLRVVVQDPKKGLSPLQLLISLSPLLYHYYFASQGLAPCPMDPLDHNTYYLARIS